ncbi:MAG: type III pantothenate kinase [Flavobacteriales bacterium]|nr:type III pantothenate kinase [Flavobacteriales bacterium]
MNLVIDIGNTRAKLGLFEQGKLLENQVTSTAQLIDAIKAVLRENAISNIGIASVGASPDDWRAQLANEVRVLQIDQLTPAPIKTTYNTPETLGIDRLCGAVGAYHLFPKHNILVIDMGTCITYDLVELGGIHIGGGISPGYKMRLDAMHHFTARLPQVNPPQIAPSIGVDTNTSMAFGSFFGIVAEINGWIDKFNAEYANLKVILTGGDASSFEQRIENPIFAAPNLVLEGIHSILKYNTQPE